MSDPTPHARRCTCGVVFDVTRSGLGKPNLPDAVTRRALDAALAHHVNEVHGGTMPPPAA